MTENELFDEMDFDGDGWLTREEIHHAAMFLGWQWQQASIFALLDYMTVSGPLARADFISLMAGVSRDPDGPYGEVLRQGPIFSRLEECGRNITLLGGGSGTGDENPGCCRVSAATGGIENILANLDSGNAAADFSATLERSNSPAVSICADDAALLLIDPQRSFTVGSWMKSLGSEGAREVMPIRAAFANCAELLKSLYGHTDIMFTRCPFPPESYDWDDSLGGILGADQLYFIKPGNCVLLPSGNGFREWQDGLMAGGKRMLVMGGCTLNSCVRISSLEVLSQFRDRDLEVVVDLSLCGARSSNYLNSPQFGGISAVEQAIQQMAGEGVKVCQRVEWRQGF